MLILTYHSISDFGGPTSIPPAVFADQMRVLSDLGRRSLRLSEFIRWHEGCETGEDESVLITFDDAFEDFARVAAPILQRHGFSALMFVPTQRVGSRENWLGASDPPHQLMDWATLRSLAEQGFEFGGHSRTHVNLTKLPAAARETEIAGSATDLAEQLCKPIEAFAAPYGRVSPEVLEAIGRHYRAGFGTHLGLPSRGQDRLNLPRIDMHYFRDTKRWAELLRGRRHYLRVRQALRVIRSSVICTAY